MADPVIGSSGGEPSNQRGDMDEVDGSRESENVDEGFTCRIDSVRDVTDVLSCLGSGAKKDVICLIEATQQKLVFKVIGRSKATQARLTLSADLFDDYQCGVCTRNTSDMQTNDEVKDDDDTVKLSLNLVGLLDCLQLFGSSDTAAATMTYQPMDALFRLSLEEGGILTTCDLNSLYVDDDDDELQGGGLFSAFLDDEEVCAVLLRSQSLREVMQELFEAASGAETVRIEVSERGLGFATVGTGEASCEIFLSAPPSGIQPPNGDVYLDPMRCNLDPKGSVGTWEYPLGSLQLAMKALGVANETFLRINLEGLMAVQHMVEGRVSKDIFLDFVLVQWGD
jgi:hypothetical protein